MTTSHDDDRPGGPRRAPSRTPSSPTSSAVRSTERGRRCRRAGGGGRPAAADPRRGRSASSGSASSWGWCSRRLGRAGRTPDHVLLSGPPGLGKTTLAMIIAAEMASPLRLTSGPAITHAGRPGRDPVRAQRGRRALRRRDPPDVPPGRGDALPGDGGLPGRRGDRQGPGRHGDPAGDPAVHAGRRHHPRRAAARDPLRDRFGFTAHLEFYEPDELDQIVRRSAGLLEVDARTDGTAEIASRSRGTPRIANRLLRRVRDYAQVRADGVVTRRRRPPRRSTSSRSTSSGLDRLDRAVLDVLCRRFGGGPVGRQHPRRRRGGGAGDRRGGGRAVPGPHRHARAHSPRTRRHAGRLGAPRARRCRPAAPFAAEETLFEDGLTATPGRDPSARVCTRTCAAAVTLHRRWRAARRGMRHRRSRPVPNRESSRACPSCSCW